MSAAYKFIYFFALTLTCFPASPRCASSTPTTGLGSCIDFIAASSDRVTKQISNLGYIFSYGKGSYINYESKTIHIQSYDCSTVEESGLYLRISSLAHELGHAEYGVKQDTSSRAAYIRSWCDSEGYAAINNILARSEVLACSHNGVDIGLAASNPAEIFNI